MYVPGFSPYLRDAFTGPLGGLNIASAANAGIAPPQPFQSVTAPQNPTYVGGRPYRVEMLDMSQDGGFQQNVQNSMMGPGFTGMGPTTVEQDLAAKFIGSGEDVRTLGEYGGQLGDQAKTNRGNLAGFVPYNPSNQYKLVNNRTGEVVTVGSGEQAYINAMNQASQLSRTDGSKAEWSLLTAGPDGQFRQVAQDRKDTSPLGQIADIALPVAGAFLLPGVGGFLGGALGTGLGAAGGSALSSVAQGRSLEDTLLRAGIAGLGAGVGSAALGAPLTGATNTATTTVGSGLGSVGDAGTGALGSFTGNGLTGVIGNFAQGLIPSIVVPGFAGSTLGATAGGALVGGLSGALGTTPPTQGADIEVVRDRLQNLNQNDPYGLGAMPIVTAPVSPNTSGALDTTNQIEVVRDRLNQPNNTTDLLTGMAPLGLSAGALAAATAGSPQVPDAEPKKSTLDKITGILEAAGLGAGLIGSLFGGGQGQGALNTIPGGLGSGQLNPVFNRPLPASSMGSLNQRAVTDDWATYGYRPERSFFDNVPLNPVGDGRLSQPTGPSGPPMGVVPDDMRFAMGGEVDFAVRGPGTGRSDEIPALLSDGEYVIDAETVALLGDGSSEAGAKRLDEMRESVRRHKGQQLAKGKFSPDAKAPEHYLRGGRT